MKRIFLCFALLLMLSGCVTMGKRMCPDQDIVVKAEVDSYTFFIYMPKGTLDNPDNYMTMERFKKFLEEQKSIKRDKENKRMGV